MTLWSMSPVWLVDVAGSTAMIVLSLLCLKLVLRIFGQDEENPMANYLLWFIGAIVAFSFSRSLGHIIKHILHFTDCGDRWRQLAPISGSINSITFVVIASVTLFFGRMQTIMARMTRDRRKIERTSQDLLALNKDLENIVFERTRAEMALRIAHEVRNPVMIIGGLIQRLVQSAPENAKEREWLQKVLEQARKLESLVVKFEKMRPEGRKIFSPLELNLLAEEAMEFVESEADDKGVILLLDRSPATLSFQGNEQLLKIAFIHLLRNAMEACKSGDTIEINTTTGEKGIILQLRDTGKGIPADILGHIFEPFYSTRGGGTGLGLPYVKQIIHEHRGTIEISSKVDAGTTVEIILPTHLGVLARTHPLDYQI